MGSAEQTKAPSPRELYNQQPDPLAASADDVESFVRSVQLRLDASKDSADRKRLKREVLSQIELAGVRAADNRDQALEALDRIFRLGHAPSPLDGQYRGVLVTPAVSSFADPVLRVSSKLYQPWIGKRFKSADASGDNQLLPSARTAIKAIWPGFKGLSEDDSGALYGFRFKTAVKPGRLDPDRQTMDLDYDQKENPSFIIRRVADELVEIVPGAFLGKMLFGRKGSWSLCCYFALTDE